MHINYILDSYQVQRLTPKNVNVLLVLPPPALESVWVLT